MNFTVTTNADEVIKQLTARQNAWKDKTRRFLAELAKIGIATADVQFKKAEYDGTNDVLVEQNPVWTSPTTLKVVASGKSITFIEFGSGVHYTEEHPKAAELGMIRGAYGHGLGKFDSWRYKGEPGSNGEVIREGPHKGEVRTHGNPPARAMYDAGKDMRDNVAKIAKEVFRT